MLYLSITRGYRQTLSCTGGDRMIQSTFLWYLLKISQYKSFSATAEALHISQPALSSAIKTLEEQLGT